MFFPELPKSKVHRFHIFSRKLDILTKVKTFVSGKETDRFVILRTDFRSQISLAADEIFANEKFSDIVSCLSEPFS